MAGRGVGARLGGIGKFLNLKKAFDDAIRDRQQKMEDTMFQRETGMLQAAVGKGYLRPEEGEEGGFRWRVPTAEEGPALPEGAIEVGGTVKTDAGTARYIMPKEDPRLTLSAWNSLRSQAADLTRGRLGYARGEDVEDQMRQMWPSWNKRFGFEMTFDEFLGQVQRAGGDRAGGGVGATLAQGARGVVEAAGRALPGISQARRLTEGPRRPRRALPQPAPAPTAGVGLEDVVEALRDQYPDIDDRIEALRGAGYSDEEIISFLTSLREDVGR